MNLSAAEAFLWSLLKQELPHNLYYHGIHHIRDVVAAAARLAEAEGVTGQEDLKLLHTAALYHDCGFISTYQQHEEAGCRIVEANLPEFGYEPYQIELICDMIRATKVPQDPLTHLEKILCDADLDYLGRPDFESIADTLFRELSERHLVPDRDTWNDIQIRFLKAHRYWTDTAIATRQPGKQQHLQELLDAL